MKKLPYVTLALALMALAACGKDTPTSPQPTPTTQPSGPVTYNIEAGVFDGTSGSGLADAVLRILDGQFAGQTFTVGESGTITLTNAQGNMNIEATHTGHSKMRGGVGPCSSTGCSSSIVFNLPRSKPWRIQGVGPNVRDMPTDIRRVRIVGTYFGFAENFAVWIGGRPGGLTVNTLLGTGFGRTNFSGTYSTEGGQVDVEGDGVSWSLEQVYR